MTGNSTFLFMLHTIFLSRVSFPHIHAPEYVPNLHNKFGPPGCLSASSLSVTSCLADVKLPLCSTVVSVNA